MTTALCINGMSQSRDARPIRLPPNFVTGTTALGIVANPAFLMRAT